MKKIWTLLIILCTIEFANAQNVNKHSIGAHYLHGKCTYNAYRVYYSTSKIYSGINYYSFGIDYRYRNSKMIELCTGATATVNNITVNTLLLDNSSFSYTDALYMLSIPVHLRLHFLKYLFVEEGISFNIHPNMGFKYGLGAAISGGMEISFKPGILLSVSLQKQWNLLDAFSRGRAIYVIKSLNILSQTGINIGLGYKFGKA